MRSNLVRCILVRLFPLQRGHLYGSVFVLRRGVASSVGIVLSLC
jgi:hypothetical protein